MDKKENRGGARPGAGRKSMNRTTNMSFKCSLEERKLINNAKGELSLTDFIISMIRDYNLRTESNHRSNLAKGLKQLYAEWREVSEEILADGFAGSVDCRDNNVLEDFSGFANIGRDVTFEEMLELETEYKEEKNGYTTLTY